MAKKSSLKDKELTKLKKVIKKLKEQKKKRRKQKQEQGISQKVSQKVIITDGSFINQRGNIDLIENRNNQNKITD
jgi:transcription antitermination factor NusG